MQERFIHNVSFYRDGQQIPHEALKVGKTYKISGVDNQTYEVIEADAKVISLYHMRQIQVGDEVFGFSPKKYKNIEEFKFNTFVYAKSNTCITVDEAKKLVPENIVFAVGVTQDKYVGKRHVNTSKVLNIFIRNKIMYIETMNTLYKCI